MQFHTPALIALGMFLSGAAHVAAQSAPVRFEFTPAAGGTFFAGELPTSFVVQDDVAGPVVLTDVQLEDAFTVGGRAAVRIGDRLGIGASLLYAPLSYSTATAADQEGGLFTYGADLSYHVPAGTGRLAPFLAAGLGAKSYNFEDAETETDFMWNVGGGLDVALSPRTALRIEARDYMSMFDPEFEGLDEELQHDIVLSAGLSISAPFSRHAADSREGGRRGY